jgi:signal transduction histidine kinase
MSAQASTVIDIIERLRSLARKRPLEFQALDVNATARDVLRLIESDAQRRGVTLQAVFEPGLPAIRGDRVSLQQVLLNLLVNAMDALDGVETDRRMVSVTSRTVRGAVEIAVSDTGRGIPAESLGRLFDAFYTTRNDGVGIGLKIAKSIADAHGGRISVESSDGHGATFRLALPVA